MRIMNWLVIAIVFGTGALLVITTAAPAFASGSTLPLKTLNPVAESKIFLPMLFQPANPPAALGAASLLSGPQLCDPATNQNCYNLSVSCPEINQDELATVKVGERTGGNDLGTILFFTGWVGDWFWDGSTMLAGMLRSDPSLLPVPDYPLENNQTIIANLRLAGYRTVQVKWSNWFRAALGQPSGMKALACRPATIARWVYDNFHLQDRSRPFCATGHSNGAAQVSYMLSHYGMSDIFSLAVLESGPNWSYIEYACLNDTSEYLHLFAEQGERNTIDWGFGYNNDGSGPCANSSTIWRTNFQGASLISRGGNYWYPHSMLAFQFGELDPTVTALQGKEFYNLLLQNKTSYLVARTILGAGHFTTDTSQGAKAMEETLLAECILR